MRLLQVRELENTLSALGLNTPRCISAGFFRDTGFEVTYLHTDRQGHISLEELEQSIRPDTILVSLMQVNNEIGAVEPITEAGALIKQCNPQTLFHVDAIQS